jgi:hypothetical protein
MVPSDLTLRVGASGDRLLRETPIKAASSSSSPSPQGRGRRGQAYSGSPTKVRAVFEVSICVGLGLVPSKRSTKGSVKPYQ